MAGRVADRIAWGVEALDLHPDSRIPEIGPGHGRALTLTAGLLVGGHVTGVDRSEKMLAAAVKRNAGHIDAGRVRPVRTACVRSRTG